MISPHGGRLITRVADSEFKKDVLERRQDFPCLSLDDEQIKDVRNIAQGAYSPLTGFLRQADFESVVNDLKLSNGVIWSIPIVLDISKEEKKIVNGAEEILLYDGDRVAAVLSDPEVYSYDKNLLIKNVFNTVSSEHPGVRDALKMKELLIGGDVTLIDGDENIFPEYNLSPRQLRDLFKNKGWQTVVAFQTRNAPHRSHEYLQKLALEKVDALFIQPVIGRKKKGDFEDDAIVEAYKIILDNYYPKDRTHLGILPLRMRYAGPREAIFHAIIRKNFGCTHFIVGRDHAGVGDYYGPYDAQKIFDSFTDDEIGVNIMKFDDAFYCRDCASLITADKCTHPGQSRLLLSGTQIRRMIENRESIPDEFMRKEVVEYLINHPKPFV